MREYIDIEMWNNLVERVGGYKKAADFLGLTRAALYMAAKNRRVKATHYYRLLEAPESLKSGGYLEKKVEKLLATCLSDVSISRSVVWGVVRYGATATLKYDDVETVFSIPGDDATSLEVVYGGIINGARAYLREKLQASLSRDEDLPGKD